MCPNVWARAIRRRSTPNARAASASGLALPAALFVYVIDGELRLVEDTGETLLRAGDCAAFPKNSGNGHHLINRSDTVATYLEIGSRHGDDLTTCSDIDMISANADGRFTRKNGAPY